MTYDYGPNMPDSLIWKNVASGRILKLTNSMIYCSVQIITEEGYCIAQTVSWVE